MVGRGGEERSVVLLSSMIDIDRLVPGECCQNNLLRWGLQKPVARLRKGHVNGAALRETEGNSKGYRQLGKIF